MKENWLCWRADQGLAVLLIANVIQCDPLQLQTAKPPAETGSGEWQGNVQEAPDRFFRSIGRNCRLKKVSGCHGRFHRLLVHSIGR